MGSSDISSRFIAQVMQGAVTPPPTGTGFSAKMDVDSVSITVPQYFFFAARLMGGGQLTPNTAALNNTANCPVQVYQLASASTPVTHTIKISGAAKGAYVAIGFTDGSYGPGVFVINATTA